MNEFVEKIQLKLFQHDPTNQPSSNCQCEFVLFFYSRFSFLDFGLECDNFLVFDGPQSPQIEV